MVEVLQGKAKGVFQCFLLLVVIATLQKNNHPTKTIYATMTDHSPTNEFMINKINKIT